MQLRKIQYVYIFLSAFLVSSGIVISGMVNPDKILRFLDFTGPEWDPSLLWVMLLAIMVFSTAFFAVKNKGSVLFNTPFRAPANSHINARLLLGALIFGAGWGLAGLCPAPALMRTILLDAGTFLFLALMFLGFYLAREK
jgi:uncharacterized membrane protein YedE/YeeE